MNMHLTLVMCLCPATRKLELNIDLQAHIMIQQSFCCYVYGITPEERGVFHS